jgi:hypothetical protein
MARKRFQNRVAESRLALPFTTIYSVVMWIVAGLFTKQLWIQFALMTISTYLIVEMNNKNALIRVYSRMVSCALLSLTIMANFMLPSVECSVVQLCFISFYFTLFLCYQNKRASGWIFFSFICLGIASFEFVQILYFVPILWIIMSADIRALSARTFIASLLGIIVPYWFYGAYLFFNDNIASLITHFTALAQFQPLLMYQNISLHQIVTFAYVAILSLTGIIHFFRTSYNDKIRTRMLYETFITVDILCLVFMVLQPQHFNFLMCILIVNTSPLIAHFIALTHTWFTNIAFYIILISTLSITFYNLWIP